MLGTIDQNVKATVMSIEDLRREYCAHVLTEDQINKNPFQQFYQWFEEARQAEMIEPNAMILGTVSKEGYPSTRTVLLKRYDEKGFLFFTNYQSQKSKELSENPKASLTFLWKELERQVHIRGQVTKTAPEENDRYFANRPKKSQLGAWASQQSQVITREALDEKYAFYEEKFSNQQIPTPPFWGGFRLVPSFFEFWQGRESRLHDRLSYSLENEAWVIRRLSP